MHSIIALFALAIAAVAAVPAGHERIVGGSVTTIGRYPHMVALLFNNGNGFRQDCGGTIINPRSILTAAHCLHRYAVARFRIRVGSVNANSGGVVHQINRYVLHGSYNSRTYNNDIATMRTSTIIRYTNVVQPARFAGANYRPSDNSVVWAVGWGRTSANGALSPQLRHVQVRVINQSTCASRYSAISRTITANMLCSGVSGGGRDQCAGDSGGPLYHNNVVVGVCSWGQGCALARFPGVNTRVSRYATWIPNNI